MQRVLIVEDEDILRNAYVNVFTIEKFDVHAASNGKDALDRVTKIKPDLIILDVLMPVMNGIEFLENAVIPKKLPNTRVLVLSNLSDKETIDQVLSLGATKHLVKSSLSPSQLVSTVRELLS